MDFHLTGDNQEFLIKPLTQRAKDFVSKNNQTFKIFKLREQHYVLSNEHKQKLCEQIRENDLDFVN
tara:strand:+ start:6625 stop:6822 length:198 start_codon:yes stop_codon:yes gene_type:complete